MNKFLKVLMNISKILTIIVLCFILTYICFAASDQVVDNKFYLVPRNTNYGENPVWASNGSTSSINDIYNSIDEIGSKRAAYEMYIQACKNLMLSNNYGIRSSANVHVDSPTMNISCDVIVNRVENYHVVGTPALNANQAMETSDQQTIYMVEVSNQGIAGILKSVVQIANRVYTIDGTSYKQSGNLSAMDDGGEVIEWSTDYAPEEVSAKRTYADTDIREKCNFIINLDTMLDTAVITREYDEDEEMYFYSIDIQLDCAGSGDEGSATYYEYKAIFDLLGKNMKSLIYSKLNFHMTMYENGYFINWEQVEEWTVTYGVSFMEATGTALSSKAEVFTYAPLDCEVVNFTK